MTVATPNLALPKAEGTDNARDYLKGAIAGGGLWNALETLDGALLKAIVDAKGDLLAGTAADVVGRVPVGANGMVLVADSAQPAGMEWRSVADTQMEWTDFTPTVIQNGTITTTITSARYARIGKTAFLQLQVTASSAGTAGSSIQVASIPAAVAPREGADLAGAVRIRRASIGVHHIGIPIRLHASAVVSIVNGGTNHIGADPNFALASGDTIAFAAVYEIA